jgi:type VI secretion system protein ImpI
MGKGLRVEIVNHEDGSPLGVAVFHEFPVRIGRDALAEVSLPYSFVTRWHAILKVEGDAVLLWDLGSTNGTTPGTTPAKLSPHEKVDLRDYGMVFRIGPVQLSVAVVDTQPTPRARERGGSLLSSVAAQAPYPARREAPAAPALGADARAVLDELRASHDEYRAGWGRFYERLVKKLEGHPPGERGRLLQWIASEIPAVQSEPDAQRLAQSLGVSLASSSSSPAAADGQREADVALQIMKELADWYHTPQELAGREAIIAFGQKIQDALDALFAGYIPLRDGLRTFGAEFEVKQTSARPTGSSAVALAQTQLEVGARALDWSDAMDGAHAFRALFADLMIHNMSLISGVMKGAAALITQLSPAALTSAYEEGRRAGRGGFAVGVFRFRELWRTLEVRHGDLAKEESETFALLFGREFAATYQQFFSSASSGPKPGTGTDRPHERVGSRAPRAPQPAPAHHAAPPQRTPDPLPVTPPAPPRPQGPTGTVVPSRAAAALRAERSPIPQTPPRGSRPPERG